MKAGGKLVQHKDNKLLESPNSHAVYYVYHRTSTHDKTTRSVVNIQEDYDSYDSTADQDPPSSISSDSDSTVSQDSNLEGSRVHEPIDEETSAFPDPGNSEIEAPLDPQNNLGDSRICYGACDFVDRSGPDNLLSQTVECCICSQSFHEECVRDTFPNGHLPFMEDWTCHDCLASVGKTFMLGEYILVLVGKKAPRFYPCRIVGRSSPSDVKIEWYEGNIYTPKAAAKNLPQTLSPEACVAAYFRDVTDYLPTKMGSIRWPIQLSSDAHDNHGYENPTIQTALEAFFYAVSQVLRGQADHPIMKLYREWRSETPCHYHGGLRVAAEQRFDQIQRFNGFFDIDILPGDQSLIQPFLVDLDISLKGFDDDDIRRDASMIANILFGIVILRIYLGCPPHCDLQVYWLARRFSSTEKADLVLSNSTDMLDAKLGEIHRPRFPEELALLSCVKAVGDHKIFHRPHWQVGAFVGLHANYGQLNLVMYEDQDRILPHGMVATDFDGDPYRFISTSDQGFTGGPPFKSSVRPYFTAIPQLPPPPKPKPAPKKKKPQTEKGSHTPAEYRMIKMSDTVTHAAAETPIQAESSAVSETDPPKKPTKRARSSDNGGLRRSKRYKAVVTVAEGEE
ncbi:hypothetical protein D9613_012399 [Agrocybe pediades]|uniref:PHD-type domain-containing protein n=1 Tax=Agrocybe pediades TaxID=84607 RepID=A0A8H4VPP4_9AGAR|nr:hypothetical protein D9613_012399 [Agrocybe pediades]